jgi:hypothetical protein
VQSAVEPASSFTINTDDGEKLAMDVLKFGDGIARTPTILISQNILSREMAGNPQ